MTGSLAAATSSGDYVPATAEAASERSPYATPLWYAVVIFVFSIPAEAALVIPGIGSLSRVVGIAVVGIAALDLLSRRTYSRPSTVALMVGGFVAWALLSASWSLDPRASLIRATTYFQLAVMFWLILDNASSARRCLVLLSAYSLGVLCIAVATIVTFRGIHLATLVTTDLRVTAFGVNPNEHGLTMVAALPWTLYFMRTSTTLRTRLLFALTFGAAVIGVILTASRGAFAALVLTGLGFAWMLRDARLGTRIIALAILATAIFAAILLVPDMIWERLGSLGKRLQTLDLNNRLPVWAAGLQYFADRPIGGVGAGVYLEATLRALGIPRSSHNTFLGVLVETGLVGAVLFYSVIVTALRSAWSLPPAWRRAMVVTLLPMFVGMIVTGWDHRKVPWLFLAIAIAMARTSTAADSPHRQAR